MKIVKAESIHTDAGYRIASFLKLTTDEGLVGWSEYYDRFANASIDPLIQDFMRTATGMDPRQVGRVMATYGAAVAWWRVVRADGTLPEHLRARAREHYLEEATPLRSRLDHDLRVDTRAAAYEVHGSVGPL